MTKLYKDKGKTVFYNNELELLWQAIIRTYKI